MAILCGVGGDMIRNILSRHGKLSLTFADDGSLPEAAGVATLLSFTSGCTLAGLALLRFGFLASMISDPAMSGFQTAASLIIPVSQFRYLIDSAHKGDFPSSGFFGQLWFVLRHFDAIVPRCLGFFLLSLLVVLVLKKLGTALKDSKSSRLVPPWELAVVLISIGCSSLISRPSEAQHEILGNVVEIGHLQVFQVPDFGFLGENAGDFWEYSAIVGLTIFVTSTMLTQITSVQWSYQPSATGELWALGVANVAGAFFQGFPVSASMSRTMALSSRDVSQMRMLMASLLMFLFVGYGLPLIQNLPYASVSAIIGVSFVSPFMTGFQDFRKLWLLRKLSKDVYVFGITFLGCLCLGILPGILIAFGSSIVFLIHSLARPPSWELGVNATNHKVFCKTEHPQCALLPNIFIFRFDSPLEFANKDVFAKNFWRVFRARRADFQPNLLNCVILDFSQMLYVDTTGLTELGNLKTQLHRQKVCLIFAHVRFSVFQTLLVTKFLAKISHEDVHIEDILCFHQLRDAVSFALALQSDPRVSADLIDPEQMNHTHSSTVDGDQIGYNESQAQLDPMDP